VRAILLGLVLLPLFAAACGGGSPSFPDPAPCPAAAPLATIPPGSRRPPPYFTAVQVGVNRIAQLREVHRGFYPTDTFSRRAEFRMRFADYADETVCAAEYVINLKPGEERFSQFDADLEAALTALIAHTREGREAVKSRNVSDYRDWYKGVDGKVAAVTAAAVLER